MKQDVFFVSRYQDCLDLVTDPQIRRVVEGAEPLPLPKAIRMLTTDSMIYKDDPEHIRLRRLVSRSFTPRAIAHLTDRVETVTRELLDGMEPGQGVTIPRGSLVVALLASANLDPDVLDQPDVFDITRSPNNHLAFSKGSHFCLGAHLARMETRVAIANLIDRYPNLELAVAPDELKLLPVPLLNRLDGLPVVLG